MDDRRIDARESRGVRVGSRRLARGGIAVFAMACVALIAGCGGGDRGAAPTSSSTQNASGSEVALTSTLPAAKGDIDHFTWGLPYGEPPTVDPTLGADYSPSFVTANLCDNLVRQNPDFSLSPNLASWKQADPKTLVYTLRKGVHFWDGQEMTSDDVAYSLTRAMRPESYVGFLFGNVASIKPTGKYEVTVSFKQPDELFNKEMSTFSGAVLEKAFTEKAGKALGTPDGGIMCTGPFKLGSWKQGSSIELIRNDDYWNADGRAHAQKVTLRFLADSSALSQALSAGEIDGAYEVPAAVIPSLQKASTGKLYYGPSTQYVELSVARPDGPLANTDLRQAIMGVIDRPALAKVIYHGAASANYTLALEQ